MNLTAIAPALQFRNFRLFWLGQIISNIGTSIQVVAEGWLIYQITDSTFWLGAVGFLALIPVVPISLLGGVLIDRVPRRKLILATQTGLMLQALVFALLAQTGQIRLWHVIALYFIFGSLLAIDHPARRAFLVDLVERDSLANAVALNGTVFNIANLVGYAAAGLLIAGIGVGGTMTVNAATYLAPIAALAMIRTADIGYDVERSPLRVAWIEGIRTLLGQPLILGTIGLMAVVGGLAYPIYGMMPAFAEDVLEAGSVALGLLLAAGALGAVIGTVVTAQMGVRGRGRTLAWVSLLLPASVVLLSRSQSLWTACLAMIGAGLLLLVLQSLTITLVQVNVPDRVRGRVMTIYSQVHAGSDTASNMAVGWLALHVGLRDALLAGGLLAFAFAVVLLALMPTVRNLD